MLELERRYADEIVAHALEKDPNECCGILAGQDGRVTRLYRVTNVEHSPYRYSMDPKDLLVINREIDDGDSELLAIYHSHTHSEAYPSATDVRMATWPDGKSIWPEAYYILVSLLDKNSPAIRAFRIEDGTINEEELRIV
jgi:proteasome lid subunit RPN8/RPN11